MILLLFTIFLLAFVAGAANATMDVLESRWEKSIFSLPKFKKPFFFSKQKSWVNKYDNKGQRLVWLKITNDIKIYKPVALTDAWHLAKSVMLTSFAVIVLLSVVAGSHLTQHHLWTSLSIAFFVRLIFGFSFRVFWDKLLILSATCLLFVFANGLQAQEVSRRQSRLLNRLEKTGLQIADNADTIFIEKPVLRTVVRYDTVYRTRVEKVYQDTCEKSRVELRHERKTQVIDNRFELNKLKQDYKSLQEQNKLSKYLADRMLDSMQKAIRLERIERRTLSDSLETELKLAKTELRATRIVHRGWSLWDWAFYLVSILGILAAYHYISITIYVRPKDN